MKKSRTPSASTPSVFWKWITTLNALRRAEAALEAAGYRKVRGVWKKIDLTPTTPEIA